MTMTHEEVEERAEQVLRKTDTQQAAYGHGTHACGESAGRGNGGFRERRDLVLESQKPTNELQAAKEGLSGVRPRAPRQGRSCNHRTRGI